MHALSSIFLNYIFAYVVYLSVFDNKLSVREGSRYAFKHCLILNDGFHIYSDEIHVQNRTGVSSEATL